MIRRPPRSTRTDTLFPYTKLFRSGGGLGTLQRDERTVGQLAQPDIALEVLLQVGDVGLLAARIHHQEQPVALVGDHEIVEDAAAVVGEEAIALARSEERRVGKECVSTCRSRWSPYH